MYFLACFKYPPEDDPQRVEKCSWLTYYFYRVVFLTAVNLHLLILQHSAMYRVKIVKKSVEQRLFHLSSFTCLPHNSQHPGFYLPFLVYGFPIVFLCLLPRTQIYHFRLGVFQCHKLCAWNSATRKGVDEIRPIVVCTSPVHANMYRLAAFSTEPRKRSRTESNFVIDLFCLPCAPEYAPYTLAPCVLETLRM